MFPSQAKGNIQKVIDTIGALGFKPVIGEHDFEYQWTKEPKIDEIAALGNNVQKALKDTQVMFKLETVPDKSGL